MKAVMRWMRGPAAVLCSVAAGCGPDPAAPGPVITGDYAAVEWVIASNDRSIDLLDQGGHLAITLHQDGTTSGSFLIPAGVAPEPERHAADMAGAWRLEADTVHFTMEADTYVRFAPWSVHPNELRSRIHNGPWEIRTVLRRAIPR